MNPFQNEGADLLVRALLSLRDEAECRAFLEDLLTTREMLDLTQRLLVARLLDRRVIYSGCQWSGIQEEGQLNAMVAEKVTVVAAKRIETSA